MIARSVSSASGADMKYPGARSSASFCASARLLIGAMSAPRSHVGSLARILDVQADKVLVGPELSATTILDEMEICVPLEGLIDIEVERIR
jgi:hypothetical protein